MGIIVALVGALIALGIAIWQFINAIYAGLGYFMGLQLTSFTEILLKKLTIISPKYEYLALPTLGLVFCFSSLIFLLGVTDYVIILMAAVSVILSLIGVIFGHEPVSFIVGLGFFLIMPFLLKKLTFPILLWENERESFTTCLMNTLFLFIVSGPALFVIIKESITIIGGAENVAQGYTMNILLPATYIILLIANLKRNDAV